MINPSEVDISALPWLPLEEKLAFPQQPAIYFAIDALGNIQYIGRSANPKQRWSNHHRFGDLNSIGKIRIAYLFADSDLLSSIESALIDWFDPPLNVAKPFFSPYGDAVKVGKIDKRGGLQNKVKSFLEERNLTVYRFIQETGIAPATGYKLAQKSSYLPSIRVLEAICDKYRVQPGELLEWVEESAND
jgi:DNA-binding Xre family transcriptional regulator